MVKFINLYHSLPGAVASTTGMLRRTILQNAPTYFQNCDVIGGICLCVDWLRGRNDWQFKTGWLCKRLCRSSQRRDKSQLESLCARVDHNAHAQIAVVTINSVDGQNLPTYATGLYNNWGIGKKGTNRGAMILLVVKDRRYRIEVGRGLESILTHDVVAGFGREAVPSLKQGDYSAAVTLVTNRVAQSIATASKADISEEPANVPAHPPVSKPVANQSDDSMSAWGIILLVLGVVFVVGLVVFIVRAILKVAQWSSDSTNRQYTSYPGTYSSTTYSSTTYVSDVTPVIIETNSSPVYDSGSSSGYDISSNDTSNSDSGSYNDNSSSNDDSSSSSSDSSSSDSSFGGFDGGSSDGGGSSGDF